MEKSQIELAYLDLKNEVEVNPESVNVPKKLETLRQAVHAEIIENIKSVFSDFWEKSSTYESFQNSAIERAQMEKTVLNKKLWLNLSIEDIRNQISLAVCAVMQATPNIFDIKVWNEKKNNESQQQSQPVRPEVEYPKVEEPKLDQHEVEQSNSSQPQEQPVLNWDDKVLNEEYLQKNGDRIIRLIENKKDDWFRMSKFSDFSAFYIELEWQKISYDDIVKLFLWELAKDSHENILRVHIKVSCKIFGPETINHRLWTIKQAIIRKKDWIDLEHSELLRKSYLVDVNGVTYGYNALVSIFEVNIKRGLILSLKVYRQLSWIMFWRFWKTNYTNNAEKCLNWDDFPYWMLDQESSNKLKKGKTKKTIEKKSEDIEKIEDKTDENVDNIGIEFEDDAEDLASSEVNKIRLSKKTKEENEKEEREGRRKAICELARKKLEDHPELKDLWFWEDEKAWASSFILNYWWAELNVRDVLQLTGWWKVRETRGWWFKMEFPRFIDCVFGKEYADNMRAEVREKKEIDTPKNVVIDEKLGENAEEKEEDKPKENVEDNIEEKKEDEDEEILKISEESLGKNGENIDEIIEDELPKNEEILNDESDESQEPKDNGDIDWENKEHETSKYVKKFFVSLWEKTWVELDKVDYFSNEWLILNIFDKIVEEIIDSKKQDIIKKIHSLTNEDWGNIISQCKMRYVNADNGSLRDMCRKNSFIEDMETEYLLQKQTEIREKVIDYIDFWDMSIFPSFCYDIIEKLENTDFDQECYDYYIDSVEKAYKISHDQNEKFIVNEIRNEEKQKRDEEEKIKKYNEMMDFCTKNWISVVQYEMLDDLSRTLKRKSGDKPGKLKKYLLKLIRRKDSIRSEEFEWDIDVVSIKKLSELWISVIIKGKN